MIVLRCSLSGCSNSAKHTRDVELLEAQGPHASFRQMINAGRTDRGQTRDDAIVSDVSRVSALRVIAVHVFAHLRRPGSAFKSRS